MIDDFDNEINFEDETTTDIKNDDEVQKPRKFNVVLYNDDYTPMEFVVSLLQYLFNMSEEKASDIAMQIHSDGKGIAGTYPFDIAESKAAQVVYNARINEHPLLSDVEEAEDDE